MSHTPCARQIVTLVEVEQLLVQFDALGSALGAQSADELGVAAQVGEDAAGEHPFGREDEVEVLALGEPGDLLDHRLPAIAGGTDRQGRLVGDDGVGGEVGGQRLGGGIHPVEVRLPGLVVDEQRHDEDDGVGLWDGLGVVGGGAQLAGRDELLELLVQEGLAGERLVALVDLVDDALLDVDTDDVMALLSELHSQRQADLAHGNDGDLHARLPLVFSEAQHSERIAARRPNSHEADPHGVGPHGRMRHEPVQAGQTITGKCTLHAPVMAVAR